MHGLLGQLAKVGACLVVVGALGCNSGPSFTQNLWPFDEKEATTLLAPNERIEQLKVLAKKARAAPANEQQRTTEDLARQIQTEIDPLIREEIIRTIAAFQTPLAGAVVAAGLNDSDSGVRIMCCALLGRRGDVDAISKLGDVLGGDTDIDVRLAAARALGQFKGPEAARALGGALEDQDPALQYQAVQSLREATGKDFGQDVGAWRQYVRGNTPPPPRPASVAKRIGRLWPFF